MHRPAADLPQTGIDPARHTGRGRVVDPPYPRAPMDRSGLTELRPLTLSQLHELIAVFEVGTANDRRVVRIAT